VPMLCSARPYLPHPEIYNAAKFLERTNQDRDSYIQYVAARARAICSVCLCLCRGKSNGRVPSHKFVIFGRGEILPDWNWIASQIPASETKNSRREFLGAFLLRRETTVSTHGTLDRLPQPTVEHSLNKRKREREDESVATITTYVLLSSSHTTTYHCLTCVSRLGCFSQRFER
jgi:hypothetical protein